MGGSGKAHRQLHQSSRLSAAAAGAPDEAEERVGRAAEEEESWRRPGEAVVVAVGGASPAAAAAAAAAGGVSGGTDAFGCNRTGPGERASAPSRAGALLAGIDATARSGGGAGGAGGTWRRGGAGWPPCWKRVGAEWRVEGRRWRITSARRRSSPSLRHAACPASSRSQISVSTKSASTDESGAESGREPSCCPGGPPAPPLGLSPALRARAAGAAGLLGEWCARRRSTKKQCACGG